MGRILSMRLVYVLVGQHLGHVGMCVVCDEGFSVTTLVHKKLIIVEHPVAEVVCDLLNREVIVHRQASAEHEAFDDVVRVKFVAIFDVGLLGE